MKWYRAILGLVAFCGMTISVAFAEVKAPEIQGAQAKAAKEKAPAPTQELICWQNGQKIIHERSLESVSSNGGGGAVVSLFGSDGTRSTVILNGETTCLSRPER